MNIATEAYRAFKELIIRNRRVFIVLIHMAQAAFANYLAFILRFDSIYLPGYFHLMLRYIPLLLFIRLGFYAAAGLDRGLWRYASVGDMVKILWSSAAGSMLFALLVRYAAGEAAYPRSIYIIDCLLFMAFAGGCRLLIRVLREYLHSETTGKRALIIGAGDAGEMIVRDMKNNPVYAYKPVGFIDNDPYKAGHSIHGIPILGTSAQASEVIAKYNPEEILIAIPSATHKTVKEIYEAYKPHNIPIKTLPKLSDIFDGKISVSQIRPLSLEDLLQRETVNADSGLIRDYIGGKSVLVTGAGGSIGSELCRQILDYEPGEMIMLDRYENTLHEIDLELRGKKPMAAIHTVIGDVQDARRLDNVFSDFKPEIVFHAAAHKHVPLMEHNPLEAVKNNIFGTNNLINAAITHGAGRFIMISTDKAVNPTSIMGATKRIAELMTLGVNGTGGVRFTTVRFGNVLGSNGSVLHLFKEQIRAGGPVTVTHPDMKRFFMLIPEASRLVLSAAAIGRGGEIFVLDMGEQIRISDLAENLIRLSGFVPHEEVKINFIGLRPGEKLYEELFDETEEIRKTGHAKLNMAVPLNIPSAEDVRERLKTFRHVVGDNCHDCLIPAIRAVVPNFRNGLYPKAAADDRAHCVVIDY